MRWSAVRRAAAPAQERGSATVLGLGVLGVVLSVLVAGLVLAAVSTAAARARSAADLGAIGAAQELLHGAGQAGVCGRAAEIVLANGADLQACEVATASAAGQGPRVSVEVRSPTGLQLWPWAPGRAVAGLVPASP